MQQITRADLIKEFQKKFVTESLKEGTAFAAATVIQESIENALINGDRVEVRGFGSFGVKHRAARIGRNPKTNEQIRVERRYTVFFKAGVDLRRRIRESVQEEA